MLAIKNIALKISGADPESHFLAYVAAILAFALLYTLLPGQHFYAPYAKFESWAIQDSKAMEPEIALSIVRQTNDILRDFPNQRLTSRNTCVSEFRSSDDRHSKFDLYFNVEGKMKNGNSSSYSWVNSKGPGCTEDGYVIEIGYRAFLETINGNRFCHSLYYDLTPKLSERDKRHFIAMNIGPVFGDKFLETSPWLSSMCWDATQEVRFQKLVSAWSGDPSSLSGFGWRMLYFSAITITTTGFGDIVPLSGIARFLVGLEAVSGWLLAGLFLNAIATRAGRQLAP
jgi:hypothetical protein